MPETATLATVPEILAALNALSDEARAEAVTAFQNDTGATVKAIRHRVFAGGKEEGKKAAGAAAETISQRDERIAELEAQVEEWKGKAPEAQAIEQRVEKKYQTKLEAEKKRADTAEQKLTTAGTRSFRSQFGKALRDLNVDPDYADEVLAARHGDRYRIGPDGSAQVLKPGEDSAFEAASEEEAVRLLAAEVRKTVPAKFVLSAAESGGGMTNGGGGGIVQAKPVKQQEAEKRAEIGSIF